MDKVQRLRRSLGKADKEELEIIFNESLAELQRRARKEALQFADEVLRE